MENGDDPRILELSACRERIDQVDLEILALLNERTRVVEQIGKLKQQLTIPIYEPKREEQVYRNIGEHNGGPMPADSVKRVFERIIDEMRQIQRLRMLERTRAAEARTASNHRDTEDAEGAQRTP